jgi:amino acid transporter
MLSLIIIGSTIGFNIIVSIGLVGTLASYIVCIACVARKRIVQESLLPSRFDLGAAGLPINVIALCFLVVFFVFPFFPAVSHPRPVEMNWNIAITGFIVCGALLHYFFAARHVYRGPVEYVKRVSY